MGSRNISIGRRNRKYMRKALALAAMCAAISVIPLFAQPPNAVTSEGRGTGRGGGRGNAGTGLRSPEISPDGHVTFRHRAPQATEVIMNLEPGGPSPMIKGP